MSRTFARRRLRELLEPYVLRTEEVSGKKQPNILDAIRTITLVEGLDVQRQRLLHDLVAQAGWTTHKLLDDVFREQDDDED
jgi:protein-disulfide isomerase-like protein with CxxC motif